jgi:DNA uptake protein ComE-like DNA-binding protein
MKVRSQEKGFLLIAVLVITMLASMVALSLMFRMQAEQASFSASAGSEQAWYAVMSGIQQSMQIAKSAVYDPAAWENNPTFHHQLVYDDGSDKWYFSVYCAGPSEETQARFGLIDENRKIHLNNATAEMLQKCTTLPATVIQQIAPDISSNTNSLTVEDLIFGTAPRPHFSTLDDFLKVPGATPGMIYGEDANHNFHLDPNEDDGQLQFPPDDSDGQLFLGLQEVATVYSYEFDRASDGSPRVQLNSSKEKLPEGLLPEKTAEFIQLAWENKKLFSSPVDLLEAKEKFKDEKGKEAEVESGVGAKELPIILDKLTTSFNSRLIGLININTASVKVLGSLPGIDQTKAEAIVSARESLTVDQRQSIAWLYSEGLLNAQVFKKVAPLITTQSLQFRFNVVGYALPSGRYRVFEVVIDTADKQPQILYLRDISRFGLPFALPTGDETSNVVQTKS